MNLVERAKNMIMTPKSEWQVVNLEASSTAELYKSYVVPLAAIGPIAKFIGFSFVGIGVSFFGTSRIPIVDGLTMALVSYVLALVGVFLLALLIDALAPTFGGQKNPIQALKVAAFSYTAAWVASVLFILPSLSVLVMLAGLYSLYVLFIGLPILMKAPEEKAAGYTAAIIVCAIVIFVVLGALASSVGSFGMWPRHTSFSTSRNAGAAIEKLSQVGGSMEAAKNQMDAANQSGNPQAQVAAATSAMAAMTGGAAQVESVDQNLLKAMLPETVGSLKRNKSEAEKGGMGAIKISKASAGYGDDQGHGVDLTITDAGGTMFRMLAAWAFIEQDKEDDNGYEKMGKVDGRSVHERFNKKSMDGEYTVVVADRFLVEAHGRKVDMDTLKQAVAAVDLSKLEGMKNVGVKQ
jgi:hypothetical protein